MSSLVLTAALVGLAGGVHCASMCGGVVTALSSQTPRPGARIIPIESVKSTSLALQRIYLILSYNSGRITTYTALGALFGSLGSASLLLQGVLPIERILFVLANLLMIAIGLYLFGVFPALTRIEQLGGALWQRIKPRLARVLPADTPQRGALLGLLWGFVPCGMVYTMLLTALVSGSAGRGALVMLAFGLGTLPNLLGLGLLVAAGKNWLQRKALRRVAASVVIGLGALGVYHILLPSSGFLDALCIAPGVAT